MEAIRERFFPGDEPEIEIVDWVRVPKLSPRRRHAEAQLVLGALLRRWAGSRGKVGSEWRFHVSGVVSRRDSYVPDIAFVSNDRLKTISRDEWEEPPFAPDVAIEIFSPGDRERILAQKIDRYLAHGAVLVLDVRPSERLIVAHHAGGKRSFTYGDDFTHGALPGFRFALAADLFDEIDPPEPLR